MAYHVLLTVDLNIASSVSRQQFNEALSDLQWVKLSLSTTWRASFKEGVPKENCLQVTKLDVASAARTAGIKNYEVAASVSEQSPSEWNA